MKVTKKSEKKKIREKEKIKEFHIVFVIPFRGRAFNFLQRNVKNTSHSNELLSQIVKTVHR
jgi:hypothetical protein